MEMVVLLFEIFHGELVSIAAWHSSGITRGQLHHHYHLLIEPNGRRQILIGHSKPDASR